MWSLALLLKKYAKLFKCLKQVFSSRISSDSERLNPGNIYSNNLIYGQHFPFKQKPKHSDWESVNGKPNLLTLYSIFCKKYMNKVISLTFLSQSN